MAKQDFAESTIKGQQRLLEVINQHIGKIPIHEIKAMDILKVCRIYEKEEKLDFYSQAAKFRTNWKSKI